MTKLLKLPEPPYVVTIFTSVRTDGDEAAYQAMAEDMFELVAEQDGFLGYENFSSDDGKHVTIAYFRDEEAILNWKRVAEHREAQRLGREKWYQSFTLRIATVTRAYGFERGA